MLLYSAVINVLSGLMDIVGAAAPKRHPRKFFRFLRGQRGIIRHIQATYRPDADSPTVWVHAASLGEFAVARPLLGEFKRRGMQTVVTFFSPTGYEALEQHHPDIDFLYYLPFDTRSNARAFLDTIRPDKAVFIVSEYWFNYLDLLKQRGIDTYLVSAKITRHSVFFKWYGHLYRRCLDAYRHIFTVDDESVSLLSSLGYSHAAVSGNPLFDNAIDKASEQWSDPVIASFAQGGRVFIAGSIHDDNDLRMVAALANRHPDIKFLMVPHETDRRSVQAVKQAVEGQTLAYSECSPHTDFSQTRALVVDFVGSLAYIYRYARWAYVGGGFTPYLHSLLEATVYGLPVAFGPMVHRKVTPQQIAEAGIGCIVHDADELDRWFSTLKDDEAQMAAINEKARLYVSANAGATTSITNEIMR